ncbi:hypothetical protein Bhyg_02803 [Pseudolycoriella hygida]|uniref:Uncharacterized protein n=1 Tax=Pseudolycoriella hygida TaxID=35572 RepID=A0A9Q0NC43_9DIPT|nr:hypothetical protein Bhyg_02803 [Pseudolycoriella hygida]
MDICSANPYESMHRGLVPMHHSVNTSSDCYHCNTKQHEKGKAVFNNVEELKIRCYYGLSDVAGVECRSILENNVVEQQSGYFSLRYAAGV